MKISENIEDQSGYDLTVRVVINRFCTNVTMVKLSSYQVIQG